MSSLLNRPAVKRTLTACLALPMILLAGIAVADGDGIWKGGENVYAKVCGHCHENQVGPSIKGRQLPSPYITAIVRNGFRAMPAFPASFIDDNSLQQVADYISKTAAPAAKP
ncbi:c-type cytochrome [Pseudomonas fluorescens]|uniref:4-cresol dehydrogenase [hydroxylating] cytochrome c subunit n=1 Tax=Pseudomonas fluorescens TaxID=294 RepID=A0A5E7G5W4_PSEFL|nr:cytochrome c [Pseudomonas fluorescens]VVO44493.1 4-cresol dehydrogenase [hydroxylating] cytochrome c subunit [Pseudomonas fluorescens]VVP72614.1 4-cresol dehydrogenase [hydroxylating] cytochrome c subunit [Pseudomonas fluorescens]